VAELVACSHRGPYVYRRGPDGYTGQRGGGGLINAVGLAMQGHGGTWIAAAMSPDERALAKDHPEGREEDGIRLRLLDIPEREHALHYDVVSNEYLWFAFHYLFDVPLEPVFDDALGRAWDAYRTVNRIYAEAVAGCDAPSAVLVEDYHLITVGEELRRLGYDSAPLLYFHHTPWCAPDYLSIFPRSLRTEIVHSMLAYDSIGFHARRWADNFLACCRRFCPDVRIEGDSVRIGDRTVTVCVAPVPLDVQRLTDQAASEKVDGWVQRLEEQRQDRFMLVRVDRIDLSKNPLRGFLAFESLLESDPSLASRVWFCAMQYPSRLKVERYRRYFTRCTEVVSRINERFGAHAPGDEGPLGWYFADDFSRSLAGLRTYDALLVNPVFDGLNLVAKEGALLNERHGGIILSRNAGAFEELGEHTWDVNPFDVSGTADAMRRTIEEDPGDREVRASELRRLVTGSDPAGWVRTRAAAAGLSL